MNYTEEQLIEAMVILSQDDPIVLFDDDFDQKLNEYLEENYQ